MNTQNITQARLKELLHYDPLTGIFTWKIQRGPCCIGDIAGSKHNQGYLTARLDGAAYLLHRLAFLYMTGSFPADDVDHKNGLRHDNRWENLRSLTRSENNQNIAQARSHNKSTGVLGVYPVRNSATSFRAVIKVDGFERHIGCFPTVELASAAYLKAKDQIHPTHLRLRNVS